MSCCYRDRSRGSRATHLRDLRVLCSGQHALVRFVVDENKAFDGGRGGVLGALEQGRGTHLGVGVVRLGGGTVFGRLVEAGSVWRVELLVFDPPVRSARAACSGTVRHMGGGVVFVVVEGRGRPADGGDGRGREGFWRNGL